MSSRSFLFVPGDRPERFDKARASGADVVILDLEDAVLPERKPQARQAVGRWLQNGGRAAVRVNGFGTDWFADDCQLLFAPGVVAGLLPKAEVPGEAIDFIDRIPAHLPVIAVLESASGIWNALDIASVPGVTRLAFGSVDFQLDTGVEGQDEALLYARSRMVLASTIAGLEPPVDGVTVSLDDAVRLEEDINRARQLGMGGKLCIHPRQIEAVNRGFSPSEEELAWARAVIAAADEAGGSGAIRLQGKLIDRPVIERARRTVQRSGLREGHNGKP